MEKNPSTSQLVSQIKAKSALAAIAAENPMSVFQSKESLKKDPNLQTLSLSEKKTPTAALYDRLNDGTYIAKYNTLICGEYRVYVVVNKIQVPSCPYTLAIVAGKSYAPASTCSGKNLLRAIAGEGSQFKIQAYDVAGNIRILGGDLFETVLQGPATIRATVLDLDDGTYQVEYIPTHSGVYELHVTLGALHCQGSPFRLEVAPSLVVPVRCCAFGKALEEAFVGLECVFTVEARDKHKNRLQSGGCDFVVNARVSA